LLIDSLLIYLLWRVVSRCEIILRLTGISGERLTHCCADVLWRRFSTQQRTNATNPSSKGKENRYYLVLTDSAAPTWLHSNYLLA